MESIDINLKGLDLEFNSRGMDLTCIIEIKINGNMNLDLRNDKCVIDRFEISITRIEKSRINRNKADLTKISYESKDIFNL